MKRSKKQITDRMMLLCVVMVTGGKVVVKDKHDNTVKQSIISTIYADRTITLPDCIHSEYGIFDVTIIKPLIKTTLNAIQTLQP
jgi:hypothetical protein